ncbi:MAG TPA: hydroxyproline-2-epimerase [Planctomycetaceae bacterium]|nr:hydroxyproline-2-epimerase [Planctomycetaceae bacterium]
MSSNSHTQRTSAHHEWLRIPFLDTHTGGEPTRVLYDLPSCVSGNCHELFGKLQEHWDCLRAGALQEPRGNDVIVGGFYTREMSQAGVAPAGAVSPCGGVVFANNVGYLGMCGHGTIGLAIALRHLGRLADGAYCLETVVGDVALELAGERVTVENVNSYRYRAGVEIEPRPGVKLVGDIAWGGNWFFIAQQTLVPLRLENHHELTQLAQQTKRAIVKAGITGDQGAEIDHIEFYGDPSSADVADGKNFVLCPGNQFDRSPCGTGTSAKLACLAAEGKLQPGAVFRQEGIVGSVFEGTYKTVRESQPGTRTAAGPMIQPSISSKAYVTAEGTLYFDPNDPMRLGVHR